METYDVCVVGGGPAGSSAAQAAADAGSSVLLVEKEPEIATTVRTSGVTWSDTVAEFGIPRRCYNPVKNYGFVSPGSEAMVRDRTGRAVVLDVRQTYRWLAANAQDAGVCMLTGVTIQTAQRDDEHIILKGNGGFAARGRVVIDASGHAGAVAQGLGLIKPYRRFGVGAEYELHATGVDPHTWYLMVGSMYSPAGYAWVFPVGGDLVRVGVGVAKPQCTYGPKELLDSMLDKRLRPLEGLGSIKISEYHYGIIPNDPADRRSVYDNVMLAGDSAGQANPLVLEGIRYAIRFGGLAGRTAADAVSSGDVSAASLAPYESGWRRAAGSRIKSAYRVQRRWLGLSDAQWDEELKTIQDMSADEFLDFIRADFTMSKMWQWAARHPRLAVRHLFRLARPL